MRHDAREHLAKWVTWYGSLLLPRPSWHSQCATHTHAQLLEAAASKAVDVSSIVRRADAEAAPALMTARRTTRHGEAVPAADVVTADADAADDDEDWVDDDDVPPLE